MLVEFSVQNFLSFKELHTFSMGASKLKDDENNTYSHESLPYDQKFLLKSAAIYGPNASGKTSLLKAIHALEKMVLTSHRHQLGDTLDIIPFKLDSKTPNEPSFFEIVFIKNNIRYLYNLRADNNKVFDECLYCWSDEQKTTIFERSSTTTFNFPSSKDKTDKERAKEEVYLEQTLENILFLSQATKLKNDEVTNAFLWFQQNFRYIDSRNSSKNITSKRIQRNEGFREKLKMYFSIADFDIEDVNVEEKEPESPDLLQDIIALLSKNHPNQEELTNKPITISEVKTTHSYLGADSKKHFVEFELKWESEGTQKFYGILGLLDLALEKGYTLFIDELDVHLHPKLARRIIKLFHSSETNPLNAQLICTTHNTNLLDRDLFRRDQIWFVEKNRESKSSEIYSLVEFSNIRSDLRLEKSYLQGRFGAIPILEEGND